MTQSVEQVLEFPRLVALLARYIDSPLGAAELEKLRPLPDRARAESELADVAAAVEFLRGDEPGKKAAGRTAAIGFHGLHDVRAAAARLAIEGAALEPLEILHLLEALERASDIKRVLAASRARLPRLAGLSDQIGEFRTVLRDLSGKILPDGRLEDHASGPLRHIRRQIEHQKLAVQESLERFLRAHS